MTSAFVYHRVADYDVARAGVDASSLRIDYLDEVT